MPYTGNHENRFRTMKGMLIKMRKKCLIACLLLVIFSSCFASVAFAAPDAELAMSIEDWEQIGDAVEFNAVIDIGKSSEPYASLDFNIVSSSEEDLSIVDLSDTGDQSKLAVDFSPDYGGAYHNGRVDETDGSVRYLVGIFSRNSGNNITDETNICTVRFRYTGSLEQELSLENLKLVYKNSEGKITSVAPEAKVSQSISSTEFVEISNGVTPLLGDVVASPEGVSLSMMIYVLMASEVLIVAVALFLKWQKRKENPYRKN